MKCYSAAGIYVAINITRGVASTYIVLSVLISVLVFALCRWRHTQVALAEASETHRVL